MNKFDHYLINDLKNIDGKKIIITGANSGIGYSIAKILLNKGAHIFLACRDKIKADEARNKLVKLHPKALVDILIYSQSSFKDIDNFYENIITNVNDFDVIIFNAGIFRPKKYQTSIDGYPLTSGINFFYPLYLSDKLSEHYANSNKKRLFIYQGSIASFKSKYTDFAKCYLNGSMNLMRQYNYSKLGVTNIFIYYTNKYQNSNLSFSLSEPGIANTNIFKNYPQWFLKIAKLFLSIFCHCNDVSALSTCYLACNASQNGDYYRPKHFFGIKGYPKKSVLKKRYIFSSLIKESLDDIKNRHKN